MEIYSLRFTFWILPGKQRVGKKSWWNDSLKAITVEYWKWLLLFGSVINLLLEQASFSSKDPRYHEGTVTQTDA